MNMQKTSYILRASECEHLYGECRHKTGGKLDKVNFSSRYGAFWWKEVARNDYHDQVGCSKKVSQSSTSRWRQANIPMANNAT